MDQSVQPGDGGWGVMVEGQAFWRVKRSFLFASGSYLVNPKDTNDTPSIIADPRPADEHRAVRRAST